MSEQEQTTQSTETENQAMSTETENQANVDQGFEIEEGAEQPESDAEQQAAPETQTQTPERPINQEAVQKKINKAIKERYEEQRKREAAERELEQAKLRLQALDKQDVVIPEMPDAFDANFEAKIRARDEALRMQAIRQAEKEQQQRTLEQAKIAEAQTKRDQINGYVTTMFETAKQMGMKETDLRQADDTVAKFIRDPGLATFILSQKDAPLIINHLADNLSELETVSKMNPIEAAAYIATSVIPAAQRFKPTLPKTPEPIDIPTGKAKAAKNDPFLEGVTFE